MSPQAHFSNETGLYIFDIQHKMGWDLILFFVSDCIVKLNGRYITEHRPDDKFT